MAMNTNSLPDRLNTWQAYETCISGS